MKKSKKLAIKKVTLRNLDEPTLDAMVRGNARLTVPPHCNTEHTCHPTICPTCATDCTLYCTAILTCRGN